MIGEDMQVVSEEDGPKGGSVMKENLSSLNSADTDSEDEEVIVKKPARRKVAAALLDDSDEDEAEIESAPVAMATGENSDDDEDESEKENNPKALPIHLVKRTIDSDEDNESADEEAVKSAAMRNILKSDLFDAESDSEDENKGNKEDSDSDIDDSVPLMAGSKGGDEGGDEDVNKDSDAEDSDEDDEPVQLSAAMLKKLKKGAAKKPSKSSSSSSQPRVKKEDIQQIHSESQRMVRESAARVPYHQPKPLGLSVFLARTQQKQQQLNTVLKNSPGCTWKTAPGLAIQPKTTIPLSSPANLAKPKSGTTPKSNLRDRITARLSSSKKPPKPDFGDAGDSQKDNSNTRTQSLSQSQSQVQLEDDELPDIPCGSSRKSKTADKNHEVPVINTEQIDLQMDATQTEKVSDEESQKERQLGQDSGFLSGPSSEEENSLEKKSTDEDMVLNKEKNEDDNSEEIGAEESEQFESQDTVILDEDQIGSTPTNTTTPANAQKDKKSFLTPKLMGLKLANVTPSLSKGNFIDLDEDDDDAKKTPQNPGIINLMDRLMKHSAKRTKKKGRDVEMNVVRKERGESGKEELMLDKMVVHLDSEEEDEDEEMKRAEAPGAKLILLKQKLTAKMRQRREEIRNKKNEMEAMDNEDGYLDDGDEEAELTDESDKEEEPEMEEEMEEEEEEEELDDDGYTEKEKKESNPFVDDEAEDDEEDGGDEEMKLELEASDGETETVPEAKDPKQFIKKALYKTKTMELFDDEALSESPVGSQENSTEQQAVSNRPFKSLSQPTGDDQASEDASTADLSLPEMDGSSIVNEMDHSADSSFDLMGSLIPAGQRTGKKHARSGTPDLLDPSSKSSVATSSTYKLYKSTSAMSEMALPIEDTQDLLQGGNAYASQKLDSQEYNFHLEDSQTVSQMLDDDGLLKVKSGKPQARRQLHLDVGLQNSQSEGMDELLALCSGKFTGETSSPVLDKKSSLFSNVSQKSDDMSELLGLCSGRFTEKKEERSLKGLGLANNEESEDMDELLALCSGRFTAKNGTPASMSASEDSQTNDMLICSQPAAAKLNLLDSPLIKRSVKRKKRVIDDEEDDFEVVEGKVEDSQSTGPFDLNSDDEEAAENLQDDSDDEGNEQEEENVHSFKTKKGKLRSEFVDEEAELSGDEAESDEDLDIAEEDDILEEELGDLEELPSDDELRNQVNRVHLKSIIDSDKRELRLLQEMYLEDGDLHSDGTGRTRKFRWKNVDDDSQQDMFAKSDEEENAEEEETEAETKWRMERYEREKFLKEQEQENSAPNVDNGSKVLKLGNVRFKPKSQGTTPVTSHTVSKTNQPTTPVTPSEVDTPSPSGSAPKSATKGRNVFKIPSHGSFLTKNKATLDKISEMTKPAGSNIGGPKDSRGFVFAQLSEEEKASSAKSKSKKPMPPKRSNTTPGAQPSKKPKLESSLSLPAGSIFNLM